MKTNSLANKCYAILPALNEATSIKSTIGSIIKIIPKSNVIVVDNLSNSNITKLDIIKKYNNVYFYNIELLDYKKLYRVIYGFTNALRCKIDVIIHLAGLKSVSESIEQPNTYYQNNLISTLNLTQIMEDFNIKNLIFSSSATVYGTAPAPYYENYQTGHGITNPYGRSKYIQEEILKDMNLNVVILRYFNPIGHLNDDLKEDPNGIPNNLFPYLCKVHQGKLKELTIYGSDYNTRDGTCSRDFIHVADVANAHKICCDMIDNIKGIKIYNVGTGVDTTVLELINTFEKVNNTRLKYKFGQRRPGDLMTSYSNVNLIYQDLGWKARYTIEDCVR